MHDLKSLGITGVQVRAVCPVGVDDISAAVQKFDADLIVADIFGAGVFHGPFDIEIVSARPRCPVGQNGQVAGRRGTQIFMKRTIVFALLDGVLLAFDLRELVYRAADDQQSSGDTNDEQGVSLRNFWRGGR